MRWTKYRVFLLIITIIMPITIITSKILIDIEKKRDSDYADCVRKSWTGGALCFR